MVRTYNEAGRGARCEQIVRGGNSEEGEADRTQDGKTCRRDMRIVSWGRIDDVLNITVRRRKINSYTGDAGQREKARDREDEEEVSCSRGRWRCGLGLGLGSRVAGYGGGGGSCDPLTSSISSFTMPVHWLPGPSGAPYTWSFTSWMV